MSGLTRDGTAKPVSRDQILRRGRGQGNFHFPCSLADHEQELVNLTGLIYTLSYVIMAIIHINNGCGEREAHTNRSMRET